MGGFEARRRDRPSAVTPPATEVSPQIAMIGFDWDAKVYKLICIEDGGRVVITPDPSFLLVTNTPLGSGGSYVQDWQDLSRRGVGQIALLAMSDQAGTLYLEFSDDQANVMSVSASLPAGGSATILSRPYGRYCRVRYVNGATAQTRFTLSRRYMIA